MTDLTRIPVLVPDDVDDPADLPMGVLDAACNAIGADIVQALRGKVEGKRYAAMAEIAFRWAKMSDPSAKLQTYRDYRIDEIAHALGMDREGRLDPTSPPDESSSTDDSTGASSGSS